jgi:hypothetical protein
LESPKSLDSEESDLWHCKGVARVEKLRGRREMSDIRKNGKIQLVYQASTDIKNSFMAITIGSKSRKNAGAYIRTAKIENNRKERSFQDS